jgi:uncharacterized membrane protein
VGVIPLPELVVVLVVALVVLGWRTLREIVRLRSARRTGTVRQLREAQHADTQRTRVRLIASCVVFMIISVPLILRIVPPNGIYGFRTALTQSNSAIWYQANAFDGWALLIASAISATVLMLLPSTARRSVVWAAFLLPVFGALAASFVYLNSLVASRPL